MSSWTFPILAQQNGDGPAPGDMPAIREAPAGADAPPPAGEGPATTQQPGGPAGPAGPAGGQPQPPGFDMTWIFLILIFVVFWIFIFGGSRREKKRRKEMLASIKKNDRVQTVGGVIGTIVDVKENEVTLKVDENANTRIRFSRAAIQSVLDQEKE
jgi:preprotein translocase subunit YajC